MTTLETLRNIVAAADRAARSAVDDEKQSLPPREMRYTLEFGHRPDLGVETRYFQELLGSDTPVLQSLPGLDRFAILRLPGVERTLPARDLFDIGYALASARGLASAEPDIGSRAYADPTPPELVGQPESASILGGLCWTDGDAPKDVLWPLKVTGITRAWSRTTGEGMLIAQPDTGVAAHVELGDGMVDMERAFDVLQGVPGAKDPLREGMANPGHGTGTASVAASRRAGRLSGAAPGATLVPIRCIEDVKVFDAAPVAAAILHAVDIGADVISLSLGGAPSRALHEAIRKAVAADAVVVAAAGNCVRLVVWPARYPEVVAVAGSGPTDEPWKGSSRGEAIDITAPAELVWRAQRTRPDEPTDLIEPGQGTSFATAIVAGAAALWLAHHGREAIRAEARRRDSDVCSLFRAALRATARFPGGWNSDRFGPGILNADHLLKLAPWEVPALDRRNGWDSIADAVAEGEVEGGRAPAFDQRFGAEIGSILLEQARLGAPASQITREAKTLTTRPSRALSAAVSTSPDPRLQRLGEELGGVSVERPLARSSAFRSVALGASLSLRRSRLESTRGILNLDLIQAVLGGGGLNAQMDSLRNRLKARGTSLESQNLIEGLAERTLRELRTGLPRDPAMRVMIEALVLLHGRPAIRVRGGAVDPTDPEAGEWGDRFALWQAGPEFCQRLLGVGRIDADEAHVGTGWVVAKGVIMTNRHVVQAFAAPVPRRNSPESWLLTGEPVTIDFAEEPNSLTAANRFKVKSVIWAGGTEIDLDTIDFADLDVALLEVETENDARTPLPEPAVLAANLTTVDRRRETVVVGYPAQPTTLPVDKRGDYEMDVIRRLNEIFRREYGRKYVAPGLVSIAPGQNPGDPRGWMFEHDSTTLAGNSGSCVLAPDAFFAAAGLHFGGKWRHANYAHSLGRLKALGVLPDAVPLQWTTT